jgi:hypothetical protein
MPVPNFFILRFRKKIKKRRILIGIALFVHNLNPSSRILLRISLSFPDKILLYQGSGGFVAAEAMTGKPHRSASETTDFTESGISFVTGTGTAGFFRCRRHQQ